jgi:hypothetical protein
VVELKALPRSGNKHACGSFIESTSKPDKTQDKKRKSSEYDPGVPSDPNLAVYLPSDKQTKMQKLKADLQAKQSARKAREKAEAEIAKLKQQQAQADMAAQQAAAFKDSDKSMQLDGSGANLTNFSSDDGVNYQYYNNKLTHPTLTLWCRGTCRLLKCIQLKPGGKQICGSTLYLRGNCFQDNYAETANKGGLISLTDFQRTDFWTACFLDSLLQYNLE